MNYRGKEGAPQAASNVHSIPRPIILQRYLQLSIIVGF